MGKSNEVGTSETLLVVRHGEVRGAVVVGDDGIYHETVRQWSIDPQTELMIKVPTSVARECLFKPKDFIDVALTRLEASEPGE